MALKDFVSKQLFGFTEQELSLSLANLVAANTYQWLGKDTTVSIDSSFNFIINAYAENPAAYEAITLISNKIRSCPVIIYEVKDETELRKYDNLMKAGTVAAMAKGSVTKLRALAEVDVPRIRKLIDQPNETQNWDQFINLLSVLLLATGNALAYGVSGDARSKKLSEMWALPFSPNDYKIVSDGIFDPVKAYRINSSAGNVKLDFDADNIAHFKTVNPAFSIMGSQLFGMAPLHAYRLKVLRAKVGDESANRLLKNGFKMGLITPKNKEDQFGDAQKKGLKESVQSALRSNSTFERFIPGTIPMDYLPIGLDSTELQILDLDKADRESIYRAYQIPLSYASTDSSTYNNEQQAGRRLIYNAVAPYCELIGDMLTKFICKPFEKTDGKRYIIRLDYMSLPELAADMAEVMKYLKDMPVSVNEIRESGGYGRSEEAGSDLILLNRGKVTLSQVISGATLSGGGQVADEPTDGSQT